MGFCLLEHLAKQHGIKISQRGLKAVYGQGKMGRVKVVLAKPLTYMNLSGEAVSRLLRFFQIPIEELVVLQDDLDLPWGKIRIREKGGHGGHKGIKSITEALGSDNFQRVKVGIGRPLEGNIDPADYVLEPLAGQERNEFQEVVERGAQAVEILVVEGTQEAENKFNKNNEL
jgi:PTH1 family peptidyl-tRNA hydrolase